MKEIRKNCLSYTYDATRKGAMYTLDGIHWMNGGELKEAVAKAVHGLEPRKDGNTPFDVNSDVPEYHASVKSSKASLTNRQLADSFDASVTAYFENVASSEFWWVELHDEDAIIYKMNAGTFERFIRKFAKLNERKVIRFAATSAKMLAWLDTNVR